MKEAAIKIFDTLTAWSKKYPNFYYTVRVTENVFHLTVFSDKEECHFKGQTVQDAMAQFAQAVLFNNASEWPPGLLEKTLE